MRQLNIKCTHLGRDETTTVHTFKPVLTSRELKMKKILMPTKTESTREYNHHGQRVTPDGTLVEFLASPDEIEADICLIRGTIPPGVAVPLHSHRDMELFYVLEGSVEAFRSRDSAHGWVSLGAGDVMSIPGNTKHAWRNSSLLPATMAIVTTWKMYQFLREVSKPVDPHQSATSPCAEEIQELFRTAARYGYWMGSPTENASIGLSTKEIITDRFTIVCR